MLATTTSKALARGKSLDAGRKSRRRRCASRWRGLRRAPADRCPYRRRGRRPSRHGGDRQDPGSASVVEHRFAARAIRVASQRRQSRVVGCDPVPNASPGSSARLIAAGSTASHHEGTIQSPSAIRMRRELRLRRAHPVLVGHVEGLVRRQHFAAGRQSASTAESTVAAGKQRRQAADRPMRGRRRARLVVHGRFIGRSGVARRRCRPTARRRRAARPPRCRRCRRPHRNATQRSSCEPDCRLNGVRRRTKPIAKRESTRPACASRASLRDSGSTSRRGGISRRAGAPGAAGCWS